MVLFKSVLLFKLQEQRPTYERYQDRTTDFKNNKAEYN